MTSEPRGLTAPELLRVLPKIDQRTDRWRRKAALIAAIGSWGVPHPISTREAGEHAECSPHTVAGLIEELIEERILLVVDPPAGQRPTTYVVNRALEQWGTTSRGRIVARGVPWKCRLPEVRFWAFHVNPPPGADEALSRASGPVVPNKRDSSRGRGARPRDNESPSRATGPETRDNCRPARGLRAALARQLAEVAQEGVSPVGSAGSRPPVVEGAGGGEDQQPDRAEWRRLVAAVKVAARAPFLEGAPKAELEELYHQVGAEQILEWLPDAPVTGAPRLVGWLVDRAHQPDPELVARLEERERIAAAAEAELVAGRGGDLGGPPGGSVLEEFRGFDHDRGDEQAAAEARRAARERLRGTVPPESGR